VVSEQGKARQRWGKIAVRKIWMKWLKKSQYTRWTGPLYDEMQNHYSQKSEFDFQQKFNGWNEGPA
jgi:hypothetical protein